MMMEIAPELIISAIVTLCGVVVFLGKYILKVRENDRKEFLERLRGQAIQIEAQRVRGDECEKDRERMWEEQKAQALHISRLETVIGLASECPQMDCPSKRLMKSSQRVQTKYQP